MLIPRGFGSKHTLVTDQGQGVHVGRNDVHGSRPQRAMLTEDLSICAERLADSDRWEKY
jgi:hypothetical protein